MIDESLLHMFSDADIENVKRKFLDISYGTETENILSEIIVEI